MNQSLRIAVADDEPLMRRWYENTLAKLGHQLVVCASNGEEFVQDCRREKPDLLISDIEMPYMDGLDAAEMIRENLPIPIILVSAHHDSTFVERALQNHVLAYLVKPIQQPDLQTAIALVMRRFQEFRALEQQCDGLQKTLEDRKLIERAKGILMQRVGLNEGAAFKRLQKMSQDKNLKLADTARTIIDAEGVFAME